MKFLILILILTISTQPLQAGFCDMDLEKSQESPHHMDSSTADSHDCCDSNDSDSQQGCDSEMNCGSCFLHASAVPGAIRINTVWVHQYAPDLSSGSLLPSHSPPLLRPPIS